MVVVKFESCNTYKKVFGKYESNEDKFDEFLELLDCYPGFPNLNVNSVEIHSLNINEQLEGVTQGVRLNGKFSTIESMQFNV